MQLKTYLIITMAFIAMNAFGQTQRIEFEAPEAYPEGIAYSKKADVFYVSSARLGTIGKVDAQGKYSAIYQDSTLKSTYGMKLSADEKTLWVCVADANYSKFTSPATRKKMSRLISIDAATGKKISDINLGELAPGNHFSNDLIFDDQGNAFITDSFSPLIYKVDAAGKASIFAQNELFKAAGVGLNGIVWHSGGFLLVANGGSGSVLKVNLSNPQQVTKVNIDQFFPGADGLLLMDKDNLVLVQNQGSNKVYKLATTDNWQSAKVVAATDGNDRFGHPSTAAMNSKGVWVMNAKFNELVDSTSVPSKKFSMQLAVLKPVK